jgi:hypothetical protein
MTPFGIRKFLIRLLGGDPPIDLEEEEPEGIRQVVFAGHPDELPPPLRALFSQLGRPPGPMGTTPADNPMRVPTVRQGPAGPQYGMRVVDCVGQTDPAGDPEVQMLLMAGWEPFGVHKFASFTGAEGVRVYFKRRRTDPGWPGGSTPGEVA